MPAPATVIDFPSVRSDDERWEGGYVRLYRRIFNEGDSVLGSDRRLIGAWIEMIARAAWEPINVRIGESWFKLQRGELIVSLREFSRLWNVPWETFRRAVKAMEASGRIRIRTVQLRAKVEPTRTLITICNYGLYQAPENASEPTVGQGRANPFKEEKKVSLESGTNVGANIPDSEPDTSIVASDKPKQPRTKHAYPPGFEKFWAAYPQRGTDSKSSAFTAWDKAQKNEEVSEHELQDACDRYATYASRTGCQTMLVQTWCNRRCWTSTYNIGNHDNGNGKGREDWYGRRILERAVRRAAEAEAEPCPDLLELESRPARW